ncbi:PilZ domain-containing protein [Vibrio renipiscarius]|uniref:Cyclic diguanosine monophosphate-binding protein n=1 Tax=Vibrio renipiscarius TaxID=1461322 RepID=A0A0C2JHG7_9VIBR|nr:PilZ domain-containing protein [Vibrio renipiscarius]KII77419.1 pilus assembly protein PilZ [Vibrio renipiscarius]KII81414.1 pilus assembly protein PilZ [Vibrio renipiscarius]
MIERRRFSRIVYQALAVVTQDNIQVNANLNDLSLHGLLLDCSNHTSLDPLNPISVQFQLLDSDITIQLTGKIVETVQSQVRITIEQIDIDSISHIKRMVELNVGDDELLHREIEHLTDLGNVS